MVHLDGSRGQSFGDLVRWGCDQVVPGLRADERSALVNLADRVRQSSSLRVMECGLEIHHGGSRRVDLLFHGQSRLLSLDGLQMPPWWPALVAASEPPDGSEVFGAPANGLGDDAAASSVPTAHFGGWHWLEFDQGASGDSFMLAGLFQHCSVAKPRDPATWRQVLRHFHGIGVLPQKDVRSSAALQRVFDSFGVPEEWGFMVGRPDALKVVIDLSAIDAATLRAFCRASGLQPKLGDRAELDAWCDVFADCSNSLRCKISLDLNMNVDIPAPTVGVEIGLRDASHGADANAAWRTLAALLESCAVDAETRDAVGKLFGSLPKGQKQHFTCGGLEHYLAAEWLLQRWTAAHSHVKLTFHPEQATRVKSYVSLRQSKGDAVTAVE